MNMHSYNFICCFDNVTICYFLIVVLLSIYCSTACCEIKQVVKNMHITEKGYY